MLSFSCLPPVRYSAINTTACGPFKTGPQASCGKVRGPTRNLPKFQGALPPYTQITLQAIHPDVRIDTVRQVLSSGDAFLQVTYADCNQ
jgi:hypothetical protein